VVVGGRGGWGRNTVLHFIRIHILKILYVNNPIRLNIPHGGKQLGAERKAAESCAPLTPVAICGGFRGDYRESLVGKIRGMTG